MIIAAVDGRERVGGRKACVIATVGEERRLPARGERRRKAVEGSCRVGAARCREVGSFGVSASVRVCAVTIHVAATKAMAIITPKFGRDRLRMEKSAPFPEH